MDSRAMLGDCMIKALMLEHMFANEPAEFVTDKGHLSGRISEAISNRNMALHAEKILPPKMFRFLNALQCSEHEIGTAVEALVYDLRHDQEACRQLARHLLLWSEAGVETVLGSPSPPSMSPLPLIGASPARSIRFPSPPPPLPDQRPWLAVSPPPPSRSARALLSSCPLSSGPS